MAAPLDNLETIVNAARVKANDAIASIGGDVFTDTQPFTVPFINTAWRRLQSGLASIGKVGFFGLKDETTLNGVPATVSADWGSQIAISWNSAPPLPGDFIFPLKLWERPVGYPSGFLQMDQVLNGLPSAPKQARNVVWEWRAEAIWIPGTTVPCDLRIRYQKCFADFVSAEMTPFSAQIVPIPRCLNPFSDYIVYELSLSRADLDSASFLSSAKEGLAELYSGDTAQARSTGKFSDYGKMLQSGGEVAS